MRPGRALWREVQAEPLAQEDRHLPTGERGIRAVVSIAASHGDSGGDQGLDVLELWMAEWHVAEGGGGRRRAYLERVKDADRRESLRAVIRATIDVVQKIRVVPIVDRFRRRQCPGHEHAIVGRGSTEHVRGSQLRDSP